MAISGLEGLTDEEISEELRRGGRFVVYQYCVSLIAVTFLRSSGIHFVRSGESGLGKGVPYSLLSLVTGWWGIPWGPIYTITSLATNLTGGKNVTQEVLAALNVPSE